MMEPDEAAARRARSRTYECPECPECNADDHAAAFAAAEVARDRANDARVREAVAALAFLLARVDRLAPHHAAEGDGVLYEIASARFTLARLRADIMRDDRETRAAAVGGTGS